MLAVAAAHGDQVLPVLGQQDAPRNAADAVAGPADALKPGRDARRCLDLDDEVDRAHVDPELERRRGHDRPKLALA